MAQFLTRLIVPILIPLAIGLIFSLIHKESKKEATLNSNKEHIIIKYYKAVTYVFCLISCGFFVFVFLMVHFPNGSEGLWVYIFFITFVVGFGFFAFRSWRFKLEIFKDEDYFIFRELIKTRRIKYSECLNYERTDDFLIIRTPDLKIHLEPMFMDCFPMYDMLRKHKVPEIKNKQK